MSSLAVPAVTSRRTAGAWRLHPGQAMSLRPAHTAWLRLHSGRMWVTLGEPGGLSPQTSGDRFLMAGEALLVPAGARLVMEPLSEGDDEAPVGFDWTEARVPERVGGRFDREVGAPTRDLLRAMGLAALASMRVVRGVLGYGEYLVAGRGRVLSPLESMRS